MSAGVLWWCPLGTMIFSIHSLIDSGHHSTLKKTDDRPRRDESASSARMPCWRPREPRTPALTGSRLMDAGCHSTHKKTNARPWVPN